MREGGEVEPLFGFEGFFFFFLLEDSCFIVGRTDAEAETPVFWSSYVNRQLIGKAPDARKD